MKINKHSIHIASLLHSRKVMGSIPGLADIQPVCVGFASSPTREPQREYAEEHGDIQRPSHFG